METESIFQHLTVGDLLSLSEPMSQQEIDRLCEQSQLTLVQYSLGGFSGGAAPEAGDPPVTLAGEVLRYEIEALTELYRLWQIPEPENRRSPDECLIRVLFSDKTCDPSVTGFGRNLGRVVVSRYSLGAALELVAAQYIPPPDLPAPAPIALPPTGPAKRPRAAAPPAQLSLF